MTTTAHRRRVLTIVLGVLFLVLVLGYTALNAFQPLPFLTPETTAQVVAFTAISAVAFLLLVGVLVLLARNLLKLYADQKSGVMGSRLRTRMLWGAILVSLVPISFMFFFSYELMNRSVDRWFGEPGSNISGDSTELARALEQYTTANSRAEAESIAAGLPPLGKAPGEIANQTAIERVLRAHQISLQQGFAVVFRDGKSLASLNVPHPEGTATLKQWLPDGEAATDGDQPSVAQPRTQPLFEVAHGADDGLLAAAKGGTVFHTPAGKDYSLGMASLKPERAAAAITVVTGIPLPDGMVARMASLRAASQKYQALQRERRSIRSTYMLLLLMMTGLALFASTWLALHLSKQVTKPVEALADAMAAIAAGDYGHRVEESATEELGELVRSFNHMAADLDSSRAQVEASTQLLSAANSALEARRGELETMLETIPNGVATIDVNQRIVLTNRALTEMLDPGGQQAFVGRPLAEVFPAEVLEALDRLMRRSHRMGSASSEMEMTRSDGPRGGTLNLAATVALLEGTAHEHLGYVIVLEDATELLRAQKQSAWKEVARRVAHEIKNPLTPISLSAEQIARHIERLAGTLDEARLESPSIAVIRRCSEVISSSVESMRGLVDQFAALAQFPTAMPRPADLNTIVDNSLAIFAGRTQNVRLVRRFGRDLPLVMADPEAMKRALGNLVDNAVEAMQDSLLRELRVSTGLLPSGMVELVVADTGAGLTDEMRERLFLPYFSTKQRGTGLGLAIAAKIIQEHGGTIRAEKNDPAGAKFIVELRPASMSDTGEHKINTEESKAVALAQD